MCLSLSDDFGSGVCRETPVSSRKSEIKTKNQTPLDHWLHPKRPGGVGSAPTTRSLAQSREKSFPSRVPLQCPRPKNLVLQESFHTPCQLQSWCLCPNLPETAVGEKPGDDVFLIWFGDMAHSACLHLHWSHIVKAIQDPGAT